MKAKCENEVRLILCSDWIWGQHVREASALQEGWAQNTCGAERGLPWTLDPAKAGRVKRGITTALE